MASRIQGITVEIGGDTTKLGNALKSVNDKTKSLQNELKGVNTLLKMDPTNVTLLKQKQDLLNKSIAECREKLNILKSTQAQVQEQFNKGEITEQQYRDFQREIVATEQKLKNLEKEAKSFGSVGAQQVAAVGTKMQTLGDSITNVGKKLTIVSAAASAALVGVAKSAIDFETAFTGVTKTVDGTDEELENIRQGLFDLSKITASSATDIASVAEAAGQLGIKTESILDFSKAMINLGDSTNLTADEAASQLAKFANIMQMSQKDFDRLGSSIVDLGNHFATTEADIVNMAMRLAGAGKQVGLSEGEVLGLATALSSVGIEAEMGGSAISKAMVKMQNAVEMGGTKLETVLKKTGMSLRDLELMAANDSKGFKEMSQSIGMTSTEVKQLITAGTNLEDFAKVSGMTAEQFKKAWKDDAAGALSAFIQGLGSAEDKGESAITMLSEMGLTEVRLRDSLLRAANAGDLFNNAIDTGTSAWEENTALTNEANKRYATTAAKMQQLKNTVTELCSKLGELLLPIIQKICDGLSNFVNWLTSLSPAAQKFMLVVLALVAALGPLLIFVGKIISSIGSILTFAPKIVSMLSTIKTAVSGLFSVLAANPIVLIIGAIVALIAIFVTLWNKCEWFRNFWIGLWENIKNIFNNVINFIVSLVKTRINNLLNIANLINTYVIQPIWNMLKNFGAFLQNSVIWINTYIIQPIWNKIQEFLAMLQTIAEWINANVIQPILNIVIPIVQKIGEIIAKIWEIITVLFGVLCQWVYDNVISPIITIIQEFVGAITQFFQDIWNKIVEIFSAVGSWFADRFREARDAIILVFSIIGEWFSQKFTQVKEAVMQAFIPIIQWFADRWNDIKNIFSKVSSFFSNVFQSAWNGIKAAFSSVGSFFQNIWNTIKNMFINIGTTIGNGIGNAFKNVVNSIISFAENTINKFIRSINWAIDVINNIPGVSISKLTELNIPKLKVGMANVPYDDYLALLHKGERVLTAKENQEYTSGMEETPSNNNIDNSFNLTINSPKETSPAENARLLRREIQRYKLLHT